MLKLLLGQWRENKKKPTLLTDDSNLQYEDPSKINPLYEDSDASITSQNIAPSPVPDPPVLDPDVKSAQEYLALSELDFLGTLEDESDVSELREEENIKNNVGSLREKTVVSRSSSSDILNRTIIKGSETDFNLGETSASDNSINMPGKLIANNSRLYQIMDASKKHHPDSITNSSSKETRSLKSHISNPTESGASQQSLTTELQIKEPNSIAETVSLTTNQHKESNITVGENVGEDSITNIKNGDSIKVDKHVGENHQVSPTSSAMSSEMIQNIMKNKVLSELLEVQNRNSEVAHKSKEPQVTKNVVKDNEPNVKFSSTSESSEIKNVMNNTVLANLLEKRSKMAKENQNITVNKNEIKKDSVKSKPQSEGTNANDATSRVKTRLCAIDDLIKKFQSPEDIENSSKKKSPSAIAPRNSTSPKETTTSSGSQQNKFIKQVTYENEQKIKEPITKIFNFPPPPPLDVTKTETKSKNTGADSSSTVEELQEGTTRSDSSLSRNKTVSSSRDAIKVTKRSSAQQDYTKNNRDLSSDSNYKTEIDTTKLSTDKIDVSESNLRTNKTVEVVQPKKSMTALGNTSSDDTSTKATSSVISKQITNSKLKDGVEISDTSTKTSNLIAKRNFKETIHQKRADETHSPAAKSESADRLHDNRTETSAAVAHETKFAAEHNHNVPVKTSKNPSSRVVSNRANPPSLLAHETATAVPGTLHTIENELVKSHSEDSGITRGDQASELSANPMNTENAEGGDPELPRRHSNRKKPSHHRGKNCKRCKQLRADGVSLKTGQCDEYYDVLTASRRKSKSKNSDSFGSDLSWEERELIRRLRSRKGTVRSNATSAGSRRSSKRNFEPARLHRSHVLRRSFSDDSTFNGSSMCSCDECWLLMMKEKAYRRSSLRGSPNHVLCTCRLGRPDALGRRVQFLSETIPEDNASLPEELDPKDADSAAKDKSSSSSKSEAEKKSEKSGKEKDKTTYRLITPWELEDWDLVMRKELLHKRRKRARYMGFMALAMVTFIGLVVALLMVYLRRKTL